MFNPGDVVVLKSGGPKMTVAAVLEGSAVCVWTDKSHPFRGEFEFVTLKIYETTSFYSASVTRA